MVDLNRRKFLSVLGLDSIINNSQSNNLINNIYLLEINNVVKEQINFRNQNVVAYKLFVTDNNGNNYNIILPLIEEQLSLVLSNFITSYGKNISIYDLFNSVNEYNKNNNTNYKILFTLFSGQQYKPLAIQEGDQITFVSNKASIDYIITESSINNIQGLLSSGRMLILSKIMVSYINGYICSYKKVNQEGSIDDIYIIAKGLDSNKVNNIIGINNYINNLPSDNVNPSSSGILSALMFSNYNKLNIINYQGKDYEVIEILDPNYSVIMHSYSGYSWLANDQILLRPI